MPAGSPVEVWYPTGRGAQRATVDVTVAFWADQEPACVVLRVVDPVCTDEGWLGGCGWPAEVEVRDRTGHRHRLCGDHADAFWAGDPAARLTAVFGGPADPGWKTAWALLYRRWAADPVIAVWLEHPAPWAVPLPDQPSAEAA